MAAMTQASVGTDRERRLSRGPRRGSAREWPVEVAAPPQINGPLAIDGDPDLVEYEITAQLALCGPDADVFPEIAYRHVSEAAPYVEVTWMTADRRSPRGSWERSVTIAIPRRFAVRAYDAYHPPASKTQ